MSARLPIRACVGYSPALSDGGEDTAHECLLFYATAEGVPLPSVAEQTRTIGYCTAVGYVSETFGAAGATRHCFVRGDEFVCLHSPLPELWVGVVADRSRDADEDAIAALLARSFDVYRMRHGWAAVSALVDRTAPPAARDTLREFYARFVDFMNLCVYATGGADESRQRGRLFPFVTQSWEAVAAADALFGFLPYRFGGCGDSAKIALRSEAAAYQHLSRYLRWTVTATASSTGGGSSNATAPHHFLLMELQQLGTLSTTLPPRIVAQLRMSWLLERRTRGPFRCYLRLDDEAAPLEAETAVDVLHVHVSTTTVLFLLRRADAAPVAAGEAPEEERALTCAIHIAKEVAAVLAPVRVSDVVRTLPLLSPVKVQIRSATVELARTGRETFWLLWDAAGLQGCPLTELDSARARAVVHRMRRVCAAPAGGAEARSGDGGGRGAVLDAALCETMGEAGIIFVGRRASDAAVLAVLVLGMPRLPDRLATVEAVRATLGF